MPGGSKQSAPTTQTVTNDFPAELKPYVSDAARQAQSLYQQGGGFTYFPGSSVAGLDPATTTALNLTEGRAMAGSPTIRSANNLTTRTLNGEFLNRNPGLDGAIDTASRGLIRNYNSSVLPGINSSFSRSGRYGSNAHVTASGNASNDLATNIRDIASSLSYQNYGDERNRQQQAALLAPQLAAADYQDFARLGEVGAARETQAQRLLDEEVADYEADGNQARMALDEYLQRIGAAGSAGSNFRSTSTTTPGTRSNPLTGALGGGIAGLGLAGTLLTSANPWNLATYGGFGALAGGLLS